METFFISQDLWDIIDEGFQEVDLSCCLEEEGRDFKESKKKNAAALKYIQHGVSRSIFPRIYPISKAKKAWDVLRLEFQGTEKIKVLKLQTL